MEFKKILYLYCIIVSIFIVWGCKEESKDVINLDTSGSKFIELHGVNVIEDSIFNPTSIELIDTLLFIRELNSDRLFSVYNMSTNSYLGQFIRKGDGPGEMLGAKIMGKIRDEIWFYDMTNSKIVKYKFTKNELVLLKESQINFIKYRMIAPKLLSSNLIISNTLSNSKSRIIQYDLSKKSFKVLYDFEIPPKSKDIPDHIHSQAYHSLINLKVDKSKIVLAGKNSDLLEIYDLGTHNKSLFRTHGGIDPQYNISETIHGAVLGWTQEMPFCYSSLTSNNDYIFCVFSGRKLGDGSEAHFGNEVLVFDWEGHLKQKYILEYPSHEIAITPQNELISLERVGDQDILRKYTLNSL